MSEKLNKLQSAAQKVAYYTEREIAALEHCKSASFEKDAAVIAQESAYQDLREVRVKLEKAQSEYRFASSQLIASAEPKLF